MHEVNTNIILMNRKQILNKIINLRHINFHPSNEHLLYYASLTDQQLIKELIKEQNKILNE